MRRPRLCRDPAAHALWRDAEPAALPRTAAYRGTIIKNPCKTCRGTGKTSARKTLEVKIPAGIDDDQKSLRGQGDAGTNGGPAGDVIVHVTVKPDAVFERDGYDVYVRVPITYSQAVLGAEIEVPTVDGKVAQKIPEGTQSGTKFA